MNRTNSKRLLSLILSLAMIFVFVCVPVSAADTAEEITEPEEISEVALEAADAEETVVDADDLIVEDDYSDANAGIMVIDDEGETTTTTTAAATSLPNAENGTITLTQDVQLSEQYVVSDSVTIDLQGYSITRASGNTIAGLISVTSGTLTVQDTSEDADGYIDGSTYTVDGITYVGYGIWMTGGTVNVTGGTVTGYRGIYGTAGTLNVSGGTVSGTQIGIMANETLTVNVSDTAVVTGAHSGIYGYQDSYTGTVTVSGGTVGGSSTQYAINMIAGNLVVSGTAAITAGRSVDNDWVYAIYLGVGVTAKISGNAQITATNAGESGASAGIVYFGNSDKNTPTTLEITGGTISGETYGLSGNGSASYSKVTISGGEISSDFIAIYHPEMGEITISGGTIAGVYAGIQLIAGTLEITNGTITASATEEEVKANPNSVANKTRDGAIADGAAVSIINRSGYGATQSDSSAETSYDSVTISGGTIISASGVDAVQAYTYSNNTATELTTNVTITGGTYSTDVKKYVNTEAYTIVTDSEGNYKIVDGTYVAEIDGTYYETLSAAFGNAVNGDTITLISNVTDTTDNTDDNGLWQIDGKTVTLDLNNYTLTSSAKRMFGVLNGGSLTVKNGSVTSDYNTASDVTLIITRGGSAFAAECVTFDATNHDYLVYTAGSDTVSLTTCTINSVNNAVVKDYSKDATITLTGCTYKKTPIVGTNVEDYKIIINSSDSSITSTSGAPEIDSSGIVRLDFNYIVEESGTIETANNTIYLRNDSGAASLTVNGGTVTAAAVEIRDTTTLTTKNGTLAVSGNINVQNGGKLAIDGATVSAASVTDNTGAAMTVSGGSLTVSGNINVAAVSEDEDAPETALTISGGTIDVGQIYSQGSISMTDGTVTGSSSYDNGVIYAKSGSISISGGNVNVTGTRGVVIDDAAGTISGGTFTAASIGLLTRGSGITISGGTYTAATGLYTKDTNVLNGCVYDIDGNTVNATSNGEYKSALTDKTVWVGTGAAQIGSTTYGTLQAAINAASNGATVILLTNVTEDIEVASDKTITLDLAGYKITNNTSHTITNKGTLTIVDNGHEEGGETVYGTVDNITHGKAAIVNYGTAYLYGGTFTRSLEAGASSSDNGGNSYYTVKNYNQMTIGNGANSVTVENDGCYSSCVANGYQNTSDKTSAQTVMNDTSIVPTLTINSNAKISGGIATVKNDDDATLIINGGTFANDNSNGCVIQNHSTATINDGTFTATNGAYAVYNCGCDAESDLGVLKIKGGTFSGDTYVVVLVSNANTAKVTIEGGTFKNTSGGDVFTSTGSNTDTVAVSSGTFSSAVPVNYCADGFTPSAVDETTGMYTVNEFSLGISTDGITASEVPATVYYNTGVKVVYVKVSSDNLKNYNANAYPTMTSEDYDNYIFAGWYSTSDGTSFTAMNETPSDTTAYAKFVDADLLTIQCVYTPNVEGYGNIWRFFTSIDTLKYKGVVFTVTSGGETVYTTSSPVTKAYMAYTVTGVEKTFAANQFSTSGAGVYVVTDYYADNSENKATSVTVTASWITPDGTTVTGSPVTFDATGKTEASVLTSTAVSE